MASNNNARPNNRGLFSPSGGGAWKKPSAVQKSEKTKIFPNHDNHKKQVVVQLSELFGKVLDSEIISSVALNCNWDVDSAIEALIEISKDASMPQATRSKPQNPTNGGNSRSQPVQEPSNALKAIKIAYQGYDDCSDDADMLVEEEEEFEIVVKSPKTLPPAGDHVSRGADLKPFTEAKKLRKVTHSPTLTAIHESLSKGIKILILMRGAPGSGKSYTARQALANSLDGDPSVFIFSTDDFFCRGGRYVFQPQALSDAHEWNRQRVQAVMHQGRSPVVVDNTNTQAWEMKPYLHLATQFGYAVELLEPNTPWCWKEAELAQRNNHGVARQNIRGMLERYEKWNVDQLFSLYKLKYGYGNTPPQQCTNPPKPKTVRVPREANSPRKKKEVQSSPAVVKPSPAGGVNGGMMVGDEAGYYGALPASPVAAQNSVGYKVLPQRVKPTVDLTTQLLLEDIKPMQHLSPIKVMKEIRTEGMEQFLSKLPVEMSVQKLVHVDQAMRNKTRDEVIVLSKPHTSVPIKDEPDEDVAEAKDDVKPSVEVENSPQENTSPLKAAEELVQADEEVRETLSVDISLPKEVEVDRVGGLEDDSIKAEAVSPCWEYSLLSDDNAVGHQKLQDDTAAQTVPSMPLMETLTSVESVMDRLLPSSEPTLTCSGIEQSDEVFAAEPTVSDTSASDGVRETHLPKLNLFSWLFPKKVADAVVPEASAPVGAAREPWQLYQPRDDGSVDRLAVTEAVETDGGPDASAQNVAEDTRESVPSDSTVDEDNVKADTSMGPASFLLDAEGLMQKDIPVIATEITSETDEQVTDSGDASLLMEDPSGIKGNTDNDSLAQIVVEETAEASQMSEQETTADSVAVVPDSIAETLPESQVAVELADTAVISSSSSNTEPCHGPAVSVETEEIPDISSNINVDCWAKLSPTYVLSEEGAHTMPLHLKTAPESAAKQRDVKDCATNTAHSDFTLLDHDMPVLTAHNRSINASASVTTPARPVASAYMLDKGSMTSPVDSGPGQYDFELLVNMFPKIPKDDLMEVFEKCQREINWTVDVLLESGYAFEPSEDLEIRFGDTEELQQSQDLLEELNSRDLTFIKPDIIRASYDTHSNSPKKRTQIEEFKSLLDLHRSNCEEGEEASNANAKPSVESSPSSPSKKAPKKQSQLTLQLKKQMEDSFVLSDESYSLETLRIKKIRHGEVQPVVRTEPPTQPDDPPEEAGEEEDEEEGVVPLTLDGEFVERLQTLFGAAAVAYPEGMSAVVDLPVALARQIHGYLMESQQQQLEKQEEYFENMIKDEEFARRLQEAELPPPDFRQIMDMEVALELYRADAWNQRGRETTEDMATRLSKQKLYELFPGVDREVLGDVFAAHDHSFADTLEVLEASTGQPEEAVRTVMSPEAMIQYEKQLIDKAKQESNKQSEDRECSADGAAGSTAADHKECAVGNAKSYREEANRLVQLRNECYQKASAAHRNNQSAVASYYAQVGHLYKQRIEEANSRAASALLTARAQRSTTLDLHYLYVAEALQALDIFLDYHISCLADHHGSRGAAVSLYIITGAGQHSVGGRPRIRPAVQARLCQRKVRFVNVNPGLLKATVNKSVALSNGAK